MRIRYWQAKDKRIKSALLDEMAVAANLHRKSLIRLIRGELARKPRRKQRGKSYGAEVQAVVVKIAHSLDYPYAERLQPNLVWLGCIWNLRRTGLAGRSAKQKCRRAARSCRPKFLKEMDSNSMICV